MSDSGLDRQISPRIWKKHETLDYNSLGQYDLFIENMYYQSILNSKVNLRKKIYSRHRTQRQGQQNPDKTIVESLSGSKPDDNRGADPFCV